MREKSRKSERGGAGIKLLLVALVLISIAHAGYNYIPVAYQGENFKQEMQTAVINGISMPGMGKPPVDVVRDKIWAAARNNDVPQNAVVDVKQLNNIVQAHVKYSKQVPILPFGLYARNYDFDYTATPTGFLAK